MTSYRFSYAGCVDCGNVADLDGSELGLTPGESLPVCRGCGQLRCTRRAEEEIANYHQALARGYARAAMVALEEAASWLRTAAGPELQQRRRTAFAR